jgi:hypothetical protein
MAVASSEAMDDFFGPERSGQATEKSVIHGLRFLRKVLGLVGAAHPVAFFSISPRPSPTKA